MNPRPTILSKYGKLFIVAAWLVSTIAYLRLFGLVTNLEAGKYIQEAELFIKNGAFSAPRYWFYSVTLFILIFSLKVKIGLTGAFIIQALLNLFAYLLFYKALKKLFYATTAFLIILFLLAFWPYQCWTVFLYTESVFFSLILILFSVLVLYKPDNLKNVVIIGLALLMVIISRPLGILFAGAVYAYLFYAANRRWKIVLGCCSVVLLTLGYYTINAVFSTLSDWTITQAFEQESIICDWPATPPYAHLNLAPDGSPVYHLWYYLSHNFSHFLHFAGVKLQYFFLMTRNYYSAAHNSFLLISTAVLYIPAVASFFIRQLKFYRGISIFLLTSIVLYALTIIFQCDDYHNRFVLSIFPFFVILAAKTAEYFALRLFKNNK